jgi:hypothetical protein
MVLGAVALVMGLLFANVLVPPRGIGEARGGQVPPPTAG